MVKESYRNALIGLFVMATLASLATLMVMFGETPTWLGGHEWRLTITGLREIRGIGEGTPVYLNGVEVGRVRELVFANVEQPGLGVHVIAGIKDEYSVPSDAVARLYGAALGIGSGQVQIFVPEGVSRIENLSEVNAEIPGEMASPYGELIPDDFVDELQQTVSMVGAFADSAVPVAANLALLLEQRTAADVDRPALPGEEVAGQPFHRGRAPRPADGQH